ncbi:sensor histidine kinase [Nocardioides plantarum]|uniref:histidine kinase n=1 Tax=Nocardioides plantarum TaxID=29299 RepID=A0ABV5K8T3_9ACTN|nr:sensor histidine kinase [Nocardioides plantarum]
MSRTSTTSTTQGRVDHLVDAALFVFCASAMAVETTVSEKAVTTPAAYVAVVLASAPVLLWRRWPLLAGVLTMTLMFGVLETTHLYQTIAFPAVVCGYGLALRLGRRVALPAGVVTMALVLVILAIYSPHSLWGWDTVRNLGFVAVPLALGVAGHERRLASAALLERAESAERTREEETLRRVGEERLRIARDVHDVVAHAMVAINVQAGVGAHLLDRDPEQARATLRDIKKVSGDALGDLRSMLGLLRQQDDEPGAPVVPTQGLREIDDLREGLASAGVDLDLSIDASADLLPAAVGSTGYRIVQEALTNVMRHVGPTSARVRVTRDDDGIAQVVRIEVEDDGVTEPRTGTLAGTLVGAGSGNGLRGMRERAAAVGGSLEAGPRAGGGWRVSATLPIGAP